MIMKKIYFTLSIIAALIFTACNGTGNQEGYSYDIFSGKVKTKLAEKYNDVHSHMENGLCIVWSKEEGHKIGFVNAKGKEVIPCIYDAAMSFSNQYAAVAKEIDGKKSWGFIDKKGKEIEDSSDKTRPLHSRCPLTSGTLPIRWPLAKILDSSLAIAREITSALLFGALR